MLHVVLGRLGFMGARPLIVDEVHTLLASRYRQRRILLNTLRDMVSERIPLIGADILDAKFALTLTSGSMIGLKLTIFR